MQSVKRGSSRRRTRRRLVNEKEFVRHIRIWLWISGLGAQGHGGSRRQKVVRESSAGGSRGGTESGLEESSQKEELALLQVSKNLHVSGMMMVRTANKEVLVDDWTELTRCDELNPWMTAKLLLGEAGGRSAHEHCAAGWGEEHRFLAAPRCASHRYEGGTLSYGCTLRHRFHVKIPQGGLTKARW